MPDSVASRCHSAVTWLLPRRQAAPLTMATALALRPPLPMLAQPPGGNQAVILTPVNAAREHIDNLGFLRHLLTVIFPHVGKDWLGNHEGVRRQLSVSSDSKLLDEEVCEETQVIMRPKKPPRPKSEVFLSRQTQDPTRRRTKRFSAFGGDSPFGKTEAYIKLEKLGEGSYATVYKGYSNLTNQMVALKEIQLQEEEGAPFTAIREASLLKQLKHANIVTLHDIVHTKETLTFVFEYVRTDLSRYMDRHSVGLGVEVARLFLFQLLRGLAYCHQRQVLHRDVKPQNLLISEFGELKLADFGLARAKSVPSHTYSHEVVTLWYRPPDVLLGSTEYSTSLDMWAVGCVFVEMLTGSPLFPGAKEGHDQLDKIFRLLGTPTEKTWPGVTSFRHYNDIKSFEKYRPQRLGEQILRLQNIEEGENMALAFLQLNPNNRIGAPEALHHKFFSSYPQKVFDIPDESSILNVEGMPMYKEEKTSIRRMTPYRYRPLQLPEPGVEGSLYGGPGPLPGR